MNRLDFSVLVPTYGRSETLLRVLAGLARQRHPSSRFEVVVVDDGSPEAVQLETSDYPFELELIRQENAGPAAARNRGLTRCGAPTVLILNDDALPDPGLLEAHHKARQELSQEVSATTAILGSFRFSEAAQKSPFVQLLDASDLLFDFPKLEHGKHHDWTFFWTCNISVPAGAIEAVGGFDAERFPEALCEDVELGYRLEQAGFSVLFREDAVCWHEHRLAPADYFERAARLGRFQIATTDKHPELQGRLCPHWTHPNESTALSYRNLFEMHRPLVAPCLEKLERLEVLAEGEILRPELTRELVPLVRRAALVGYLREILRDRDGDDPERSAYLSPTPELLTSVVVISHNGLEDSKRCLDAIREAADPAFPTEILWVDNGSEGECVEYLRKQPDVELIENPTNIGAPRARNQALGRARGDWIVFMDNDAFVSPGWLAGMRNHAARDPEVGCVCPVSNRAAHGQQIECPEAADPASTREFAELRAEEARGMTRYTRIFTSFCVLVRRDVIDAIGGFDETFSPWGFEDDDFSLRAALAGFRCRVALDVFVRHGVYQSREKSDRHDALLIENWRRFVGKWGDGVDYDYGDYGFLDRLFQGDPTTRSREALRVPLDVSPPGG